MAAVTPLREEQFDVVSRRQTSETRRATHVTALVDSAPAGRPLSPLQVVPRRRRAASIVASGCVVLFLLLLGTVALQTRIAQNQLALDSTERAVKIARERYDMLRHARAELRSPNRLAVEATQLGMAPASKGEFMTISPETVARVWARAGWLANNPADNSMSSFDQFGHLKAVAGNAP